MKSLLLLLYALVYASNAEQTQLRKRELPGITDHFECILIEVTVDLDDNDSKFEHMCQGRDANGDFDMIYYIDDNNDAIPPLDEEGYDVLHNSGRYRLSLTNIIENSNAVISTTPDTDWEIHDLEGVADQGRRLGIKSIGTSTIAVVRVSGNNNVTPKKSAAELSNAFFGTHGDPQNLKKRYDVCSMGKMIFNPASGAHFVNGVTEIKISQNIIGQDVHSLSNIITMALYEKFDKVHLFTRYDHVAYIMPEGTTYGTGGPTGWMAFAYMKQYLSVFNDENAMYLSHQVHEIGHNLGMYHSSHDQVAYGDQSGVMGYGYTMYDAPKMCFNGAKSWQLGWYRDKAIELQNIATQSIYLSFFGDYDGVPYNSESDVVLIKIGNYHLIYNLKKGINSETQEFENKVAITFMRSEKDLSSARAALGVNDNFSFDGVVVEFCDKTNIGGVDKAMLSIYPSGRSSTCGNFKAGLTSGGPVASPTSPQTRPPTPAPVPARTPAPVPAPVPDATNRPIPDPTNRPVTDPTRAPVPDPTKAPVPLPTEVPADRTCKTGEMKVEVKLTTNNTPEQISWILKERNGPIIDRRNINSYSSQNTEHSHQHCVDESKIMEFHLKDESGQEYPGGRYEIVVDGETYSEGDIVAEEVDYIQGKCKDAGESRLQFILNTGKAPQVTGWTMKINNDQTVYTGGPWTKWSGTPLHFFSNSCLDNSLCYSITMQSNRTHPHNEKLYLGLDEGSYEINWDDENVKYSLFESGHEELTRFGNCEGLYYEPESEEKGELVCDCTDEPIDWMKTECDGSHFINTKCNKNANWRKNKYCRLSCYNAGNGYEGDVCTCTYQ